MLAEDLLADDGLAGRLVARLEAQGFGEATDRSRVSKLKKLDQEIEVATAELREAKRQAAYEAVEAEFSSAA